MMRSAIFVKLYDVLLTMSWSVHVDELTSLSVVLH